MMPPNEVKWALMAMHPQLIQLTVMSFGERNKLATIYRTVHFGQCITVTAIYALWRAAQ